jgi:glucose/arabinose dehydrogenase
MRSARIALAPLVLSVAIAVSTGIVHAPQPASAVGPDTDRDGVSDAAEAVCGGNANNSRIRPERTDDVFAGRNDDGDGQTDEGLPPSAAAEDCDGDGYAGSAEDSIFGVAGRDQDACGTDAWPSDFVSGGVIDSTDRVNIADLNSFLAPRRLNTNPGDPSFSPRWDLSPGAGVFTDQINIQDLTALLSNPTGFPHMFGDQRAFDGRRCPWPLTTGWSLGSPIPNATYPQMVALVPIPGRPDEAVIVAQKQEKAYRISLSGAFAPVQFGDLTAVVGGAGSEEGFLALAFAPGFPGDSRVYAYYTRGSPNPSVLSRFPVSGDVMVTASEEVVLQVPQPNSNHNGGELKFGPDGFLYLSLGDGGGSGDPGETGQDNTDLLGSVLRLDVSGATGYTIPPGNPFAGVGDPGADEVWAYGMRNPWRFSFDSESGDLWLADVGQGQWEETDRVIAGGNYGWDCFEGNASYEPAGCDGGVFQAPRTVYDHTNGCAVTGGYVYHGSQFPALAGWYIYGDYCSGRVWAVNTADTASPAVLLMDSPYSISSFAELPDGEILAVTFNSAVYRLSRD